MNSGIDRRKFVRALASSALLGASGVLGVRQAAAQRFFVRQDRFGRMFPRLPSFAEPSEALRQALLDIGRPGGLLDAKDDLAAGPVALIVDPALSANNPNNAAHTAGTTFMGQFMDHDMTFDLSSTLGVPAEPEEAPNSRTPAFDLDSVYGGGPARSPQLYDRRGLRFRLESGGLFEDLPRTASGKAIIPDPRNDENLMIAGLHAAFLLFHNHVVDHLAKHRGAVEADDLFRTARRLATWHYHWMIVHEFLPLFIGQELVDEILHRGCKYYRPRAAAFIPVEFQGAAYRFGHSMVRPSYRANLAGDHGAPFFGMIFDPAGEGAADPVDLRGGARAPRRFIGWQTFFDFGDGNVKPNKLIDAKISTPLFHLPLGAIATGDAPTSLPQRNLLRQVTWSLPCGQALAREMRADVLGAEDLDELSGYGLGLETSTPLWYYVLKEAALLAGGRTLGPVGARIVGEVIIGLLEHDRHSYLSAWPLWRPTLPDRRGNVTGEFCMVDFLSFARVDPASRGQ
jgi:hypothetical protein